MRIYYKSASALELKSGVLNLSTLLRGMIWFSLLGPMLLGHYVQTQGFAIYMTQSRSIRLIVISLILVCTAGCDQVTKHLARAALGQRGSNTPPGRFVEFTLAENPGAFLNLGASLSQAARSALTACLSVGLAFLLAYLVRTPRLRPGSFLGLALIWSGGISNLIDRFIHHGLVTDFMVVRAGPLHTGVFNLADFAIVAGILVLITSSCTGARDGKVHHDL